MVKEYSYISTFKMGSTLENRHITVNKQDWRCLICACGETGKSPSQEIRKMIKKFLKDNEKLIVTAMEKQRLAIQKRKANGL